MASTTARSTPYGPLPPQAFASGARRYFNRPSWQAGREKFAHLHIERVKPLRYAEANGTYNAFFEQFNYASSSR